jgi:hypothetical protein
MSVVQVSGATIGAFHEIAFIANRYSIDHFKPEEVSSPESVGIIVSVFADMYPTYFSFSCGVYCSVSSISRDEKGDNPEQLTVALSRFRHSWLTMKNSHNVIVDVLPLSQPTNFKTPSFIIVDSDATCGVAGYKVLDTTRRSLGDALVVATKRDELGDIFTELQHKYRAMERLVNG